MENEIRVETEKKGNFIDEFIKEDIAPNGRFAGQRVHTRFPPEPKGNRV